jgi:cellobiose phosphorylase
MNCKSFPYAFQDAERKIVFDRYDLPAPWINYLSNGRMHAFVSQAGGGMCWWRTPQNYRITRYRFYHMPIDSPGFYVYLRMQDGTVWSPTFRPCATQPDGWQAAHSTGYSTFTAEKNGLKATLKLFMATDSDTLIWDLRLVNQKNEPLECDVFAYVEFSQLDFLNEVNLGYYLKWNTDARYDAQTDAILYLYTSWMQLDAKKSPVVYFAGDTTPDSYCCNRDLFCGNYRDERDPVGVEEGKLGNQNMAGGEPCGALHRHIVLAAGGEQKLHYFLGVTAGALADYDAAKKATAETLHGLRADGGADLQFAKNMDWWNTHLNVYQCAIPDEDAARQINTWNPIQSVVTARFSRSISSSASGIRGVGFRDTAQDMLAQAYRKPEWAAEMLCCLAGQQLEDGHVVHAFWPEENRLPQDLTRSDDHIWMVYLAYAIVAESGDLSVLEREIPFLDKDLKTPVAPATLWEHLLRGIAFTEHHLGAHGLPLILFSDWNDHLGPFGRKGRGETVFVSQQHIYALRQLSELAALRGDTAAIERFAALIQKQEAALAQSCWDGAWYLRGFDDDAKPIGTHTEEYAKIWVNTQSWMVIAGSGEPKKNVQAMDSVRQYMDTGMGLLINTPGFPTEPGAASHKANGLPAGYSENGGIFCQANCWAIIAEALLGRGDLAWKYYKQIMPNEVIKRIGVDAYRGEAYAYSSTMLGPDNEQFGQSCVSQVTGTAAWMDVAATQYLLGVRPTVKGLVLDPTIPSDWKQYTVSRLYRGCTLTITVNNAAGVQHGVRCVAIDGSAIGGNIIAPELLAGRKQAAVTVEMG